MLIGDLANRVGCDSRTIRYYEREGLLPKPSRTCGGYRRYTDATIAQLRFIRQCRALGITLAEIKTLHHLQTYPELACGEINSLLDRHIASVHHKIEGMRLLEMQLRALRRCCHDGLTVNQCGIINTLVHAADDAERGQCAQDHKFE